MFLEIDTIKDIEKEIDENCLIAFDLDNTLITSSTYFGSILWEDDLIIKFQKNGLSYEESHNQACQLWNEAQRQIQTILIEKESNLLIDQWKNKSNVIGLTARNINIKDLTNENLKSNNILFSPFSNHNFDLFHEGVLYCANLLKSEVLLQFIDKVLIKKPSKIIIIDDKKNNLDDLLSSKLKDQYMLKCFHYLNDPHKK